MYYAKMPHALSLTIPSRSMIKHKFAQVGISAIFDLIAETLNVARSAVQASPLSGLHRVVYNSALQAGLRASLLEGCLDFKA